MVALGVLDGPMNQPALLQMLEVAEVAMADGEVVQHRRFSLPNARAPRVDLTFGADPR
jgi:hypothetical protein